MEQWAELRREHFVAGKSIKRLVRETGLSKNTIRRALRSEAPPSYRRAPKARILEPFKPEIHRLLGDDPKLPGVRVRELLEPLGCTAGKTVVDDYLREVRPLFAPPAGRLRGRCGGRVRCASSMCGSPAPRSRSGTARRGRGGSWSRAWGISRAGAGVLVFSKQTEDLLAGISGCLTRLGALPQTLLWDRQAGIHGHGGRPTDAFAAFCGQLRVGWRFCEPADPQAKGAVERLQGYAETNFEPGRRFANELDFQDQLDRVVREGQRRGRTRRCETGRSTAWRKSAR